MDFKSKNTPYIILVATSLFCSRSAFFFIDDPEGPNLLVVTVLAVVIYFLSLAIFSAKFLVGKMSLHLLDISTRRLLLVILIQILMALLVTISFNWF